MLIKLLEKQLQSFFVELDTLTDILIQLGNLYPEIINNKKVKNDFTVTDKVMLALTIIKYKRMIDSENKLDETKYQPVNEDLE